MTDSTDKNMIEVSVTLEWETEKAWGVNDGRTVPGHPFRKQLVWLPKSKCEIISKASDNSKAAEFLVPEWLAKENRLI